MANTFCRWDMQYYRDLINRFDLPWDKQFKQFSKGMKMKLAIAIAMSHHSKLLLLDEPTGGLDPVVRGEVIDMFYEFTRDFFSHCERFRKIVRLHCIFASG